MRQIIYFCDSDKDDLYTLCFLVKLHANKKLKLEGIVVDDGFLGVKEGLKVVSFLLDLLKVKIPIYQGYERNNGRHFPKEFVDSFFKEFSKEFGYQGREEVKTSHVKELRIEKGATALVTGPLSSIPKLDFNQFKRIHIMAGNYAVEGNLESNGEYNLWLDPDSFNLLNKEYKGRLSVCPLDCTNYAPISSDSVKKIANDGSIFSRLIRTTLLTVNSSFFYWDLAAVTCLLWPSLAEKKRIRLTAHEDGYFVKGGKKRTIYTYISFRRMLNKVSKVMSLKG